MVNSFSRRKPYQLSDDGGTIFEASLVLRIQVVLVGEQPDWRPEVSFDQTLKQSVSGDVLFLANLVESPHGLRVKLCNDPIVARGGTARPSRWLDLPRCR